MHLHMEIFMSGKRKKEIIFFFVDYDSKKNRVSEKILVSDKILECWKALIENEIATGE